MKNKNLAAMVLISIGVAIFTGIFELGMTTATADSLYTIAGLGMIVFGVWASIRLIHTEDKK